MNEIVLGALERVKQEVDRVLDETSRDNLTWRPNDDANTIAWLIWHLSRVIDNHVSELQGTKQVWVEQEWVKKFDLPFEKSATGYGQTPEAVGQVQVSAEDLRGYFHDVYDMATTYVGTMHEGDYRDIIDTNWDPPVTRAIRLISVLSDSLQHVGQAAYIKGLAE